MKNCKIYVKKLHKHPTYFIVDRKNQSLLKKFLYIISFNLIRMYDQVSQSYKAWKEERKKFSYQNEKAINIDIFYTFPYLYARVYEETKQNEEKKIIYVLL